MPACVRCAAERRAACRSFFSRGKKPRKVNSVTSMPDTDMAAAIALGPGTATTSMPASAA